MGKKQIINGNCLEVLRGLLTESVDAIVTDPPYELGFMGKAWDASGIAYNVELWRECLRVLKPGGHLLAFSGTRTYHRMAVAIEDAGFEVRDMLEWIYASGFPKSLNVGKAVDKLQGNEREVIPSKRHGGGSSDIFPERNNKLDSKGNSEWEGFGTALKPAHEPICMARKPLSEKTIVENVLKHGTGAIDIDGCRIPTSEEDIEMYKEKYFDNEGNPYKTKKSKVFGQVKEGEFKPNMTGRFPANIICTDDALNDGVMTNGGTYKAPSARKREGHKLVESMGISNAPDNYGDSGSKSRYFDIDVWAEKHGLLQFPKASKRERNEGLNNTENLWFNNLELIAESCIFTVENLFIQQWEKQDQNQNTDFNGEVQQQRGISEVMIAEVGDSEWNTILCGKKQMAIFPKAIKFTTSTESSQIIELKTLNYYQHLTTSDCIADVQKTAMENGLSLAENVGLKNLLKLIFTKDEMGFPLGVKVVAKKTPQSISVKERLKLSNIHSTVKPVHLMAWLVRLVSKEGDTVLDPFAGSGTTGVACKKLKRNVILIEQNLEYIEIIKARMEEPNKNFEQLNMILI